MLPAPRATRRLAAPLVALSLTAVTALTSAPALAGAVRQSTHDDGRRLSAAARADGLTAAGGGEMGWRLRGSGGVTRAARPSAPSGGGVEGVDVANAQGADVDWTSFYARGKRFAFVKATEGSSYTSPSFAQQYAGAHDAGLLRGAYHFANPAGAAGGQQAQYFVDHGGDWTTGTGTLPGVLDVEYNPYDDGTGDCYGLRHAAMTSWIRAFVNRYKLLTGRNAVIYTTTDWWTRCTGGTTAFARTDKLWIARYAATPGSLPRGWSAWTFWQYAAGNPAVSGSVDRDRYPGTLDRLRTYAG